MTGRFIGARRLLPASSLIVAGIIFLPGGTMLRGSLTPQIDGPGPQSVAGHPGPKSGSALHGGIQSFKPPLSFEQNLGQTGKQVKFLSRPGGYMLLLEPNGALIKFGRGERTESVRMRLRGANRAPRVSALGKQSGVSNYFGGGRSIVGAPHFSRVLYRDVYRNIDLAWHGKSDELEYDFVVKPGGDPTDISLSFEGAGKLKVDARGGVKFGLSQGILHQPKPTVYQRINGTRKQVAGAFKVRGSEATFMLGPYDPTKPLVIDPVISYSTFLGNSEDDGINGMAVDESGHAFVAGETQSPSFPTAGPAPMGFGGGTDAFVTKFTPDGRQLIYSTFLGGSGTDGAAGIAIDSFGKAYVVGGTDSANFLSADWTACFQCEKGGGFDAFIAKLKPSGELEYSSYLGGSSRDVASGIAADPGGVVHVSGDTDSIDLPLVNALDDRCGTLDEPCDLGRSDAFIARFNPSLSPAASLVTATYIGGAAADGAAGIAADSAGASYLAGWSDSAAGDFAKKLNPVGDGLSYDQTFPNADLRRVGAGNLITVDASGRAYVTGQTSNGSARQSAQIIKLDPSGAIVFSAALGGSLGETEGDAIYVDGSENVYITGATTALDFVTRHPIQPLASNPCVVIHCHDVIIARLDTRSIGLDGLVWSSFLGGFNAAEFGRGIALDGLGNVYVGGGSRTNSRSTFPTTPGAHKASSGEDATPVDPELDGFVTKIAQLTIIDISPKSGLTCGGERVEIHGFGFTGVTEVKFGPVAATHTVESDTLIVATSPPRDATGQVEVSIGNPDATVTTPLLQGFTYTDPSSPCVPASAPSPPPPPSPGPETKPSGPRLGNSTQPPQGVQPGATGVQSGSSNPPPPAPPGGSGPPPGNAIATAPLSISSPLGSPFASGVPTSVASAASLPGASEAKQVRSAPASRFAMSGLGATQAMAALFLTLACTVLQPRRLDSARYLRGPDPSPAPAIAP